MKSFTHLRKKVEAVVIGASAGGIDALGILLPPLPATLRPPIVVVLHLRRDAPSLLAEIFAPRCALAVREAEDKEPLAPHTVYFAPPDYHLLIDKGAKFVLSADEPVNFSRPSIDVLFESAADIYRERLLGIILTGANSDGAAGLDAIRRAGGTTVVQQLDGAAATAMISSVLQRMHVDFVLSLHDIAQLLCSLECDS